MKVFFTASQRGRDNLDKQYKKIFEEIKGLGYQHVDNEIVTIPSKEFYTELSEGGRNANVMLYKNNIKNLTQADINVFECSLHSISLGFMINKSLSFSKPTIVLYYKENVPYFVDGIQDEKLLVKSYNDTNVKTILTEAFELAKNLTDKRFNFFISPELLSYLNDASKELGITKSTFIRNLIVEHRKKTRKA